MALQIISATDQAKIAESFMSEEEKEEEMKGMGCQRLQKINHLIQRYSNNASVVFTDLPLMPSGVVEPRSYVSDLEVLSSKWSAGNIAAKGCASGVFCIDDHLPELTRWNCRLTLHFRGVAGEGSKEWFSH